MKVILIVHGEREHMFVGEDAIEKAISVAEFYLNSGRTKVEIRIEEAR